MSVSYCEILRYSPPRYGAHPGTGFARRSGESPYLFSSLASISKQKLGMSLGTGRRIRLVQAAGACSRFRHSLVHDGKSHAALDPEYRRLRKHPGFETVRFGSTDGVDRGMREPIAEPAFSGDSRGDGLTLRLALHRISAMQPCVRRTPPGPALERRIARFQRLYGAICGAAWHRCPPASPVDPSGSRLGKTAVDPRAEGRDVGIAFDHLSRSAAVRSRLLAKANDFADVRMDLENERPDTFQYGS